MTRNRDLGDTRPYEAVPAEQRAFDRFRREYNEGRPHEVLDLETRSSLYRPSARRRWG